jgi:quercetin dioxygenase-like cupin family protein
MIITDLKKTEKTRVHMEGVKDVFKQVPLSRKDSAPLFSFRVFSIDPGGNTPFHNHAFEHLNYVITGHGAVVDKTGKERELKEGDFIMVLPDEIHQYKNSSAEEPFVFICAVPKEYE